MKVSVEVNGVNEVIAGFSEIESGITDLRKNSVWIKVRQVFYRIVKGIFESEGGTSKSGKWAPLSSRYQVVKQRKYGSMPILQASRRLYKSLAQPGADTIVEENATDMTVGTSVPYGGYHQTGTSKMPKRSMLDFTDAHEKELMEPIEKELLRLIQNAKLRGARGF